MEYSEMQLRISDTEETPIVLICPVIVAKKRRCQPNQGPLNQLISTAKTMMLSHGHKINRFDRDYALGRATSFCAECNQAVTVDVATNTIGGTPVKTGCDVANS